MFGDSNKKVIDWAFAGGIWGAKARHQRGRANFVMFDGHVEAQEALLTNSNGGRLILKIQ